MKKRTVLRLGGFITAACATTALVAAATQSTGAWFTDSHQGQISGNAGHLNLLIQNGAGTYADADSGTMNLNFANMMPGDSTTKSFNFETTASSGNVDLWLTFDPRSTAYGEFTGTNGVDYSGYSSGGLGGYGHFKVAGPSGSFESYNLQLDSTVSHGAYQDGFASQPGSANTQPGAVCHVNSLGIGGESAGAVADVNNVKNSGAAAECGVPAAIRVGSNLPSGYKGTISVTFGLTGKQTGPGQPEPTVPFTLVATQAGHTPTDGNF